MISQQRSHEIYCVERSLMDPPKKKWLPLRQQGQPRTQERSSKSRLSVPYEHGMAPVALFTPAQNELLSYIHEKEDGPCMQPLLRVHQKSTYIGTIHKSKEPTAGSGATLKHDGIWLSSLTEKHYCNARLRSNGLSKKPEGNVSERKIASQSESATAYPQHLRGCW